MSGEILTFPWLAHSDPNPAIFAKEARERGLLNIVLEMQYDDKPSASTETETPGTRIVQCAFSKTAVNEEGNRGIIAVQESICPLFYKERASKERASDDDPAIGGYAIVPTLPGFALLHLSGGPENRQERVLAAFLYANHNEFVHNYAKPAFKVTMRTSYNGQHHRNLTDRLLARISEGFHGFANAPLDEYFWRTMLELYDSPPSRRDPVPIR